MTRQQLILLIGMAVALLLDVIRRMRQRRIEREVPRGRPPDVSERPQPPRQPPAIVAPLRPPRVTDSPPVPPPVLMTILGPCRAMEPPDPQA
jgi:hypothetical protein